MTVRLAIQAARMAGEAEPMAIVLIDCSDTREAEMTAKMLRIVQNGEATLATLGDSVLFGDTALRLSFLLSEQDPERVRVILEGRRSDKDLTEAVYLETEVDRRSAEVFRWLHNRRRSYALTLSVDGVPRMDMLYLAKYIARYPWRSRLKSNENPPGSDAKDVMKLAGLPGWDQSSPF
ncbi:MAG: hypothetical protein ACM3XN_04940 [Chloroflexota bacterium]